jgi:hypothetical protein
MTVPRNPFTLLCRLSGLLALALPLSVPAVATEAPSTPPAPSAAAPSPAQRLDQSLFLFGGPYIAGYFNDTFDVFGNDYYGDNVLGGGYQKFFYSDPKGFSFGTEIGTGGRFGVSGLSLEVWGGGVARYDGLVLFDTLRVSPAVTVGFSYVAGKIKTEAEREVGSGDSADLLFYLAPELDFSLAAHPEWEAFVRAQHRSGLYGTMADIDGANAAVVGLRKRF